MLAQCAKKFEHGGTTMGIEIGCWFIGDDERWVCGKCTCNGDALLLPTRQLTRPMVGMVEHVELCECPGNPSLPFVTWNLGDAQCEFNIFVCRCRGNQRKALKDEPDTLAECCTCFSATPMVTPCSRARRALCFRGPLWSLKVFLSEAIPWRRFRLRFLSTLRRHVALAHHAGT